jgi:hypothetical protein
LLPVINPSACRFPACVQLFAPQLQPASQLLRPLEQRQQALLQGSGLSCAPLKNHSALLYLPMHHLSYKLVLLLLLLLLLYCSLSVVFAAVCAAAAANRPASTSPTAAPAGAAARLRS